MDHRNAKVAIRLAERLVGRRRLAKAARLLTNQVRLDGPNSIEHNGEQTLQRLALSNNNPVVLDVGCHYGEWSRSLLQQEGNTPKLHAFEPSAHSFQRAQTELRGRAHVHQMGLSNKPGEAELFIVHVGAGSNSIVPRHSAAGVRVESEIVKLSTVDAFCSEQELSSITLLKIDAEGHDLAVLQGAEAMLKRNAIELIQFEYNARWIDARNFLVDAFELLEGNGYLLGKLTPRGVEAYEAWHPELESFREANYVAYLPKWSAKLPTFDWWGG